MFRSFMMSSSLVLSLAGFAHADAPTAFDVAENHTRIFMASAPVHDDGMPAHGNAFISQGYIYPAGTLSADTSGVLKDGSPAFPDKVLGTWTCDGYFVGEGGNATTGVWVISRQVFDFAEGDKIVTQGTEIVDTGVENQRPITGATGDYANFDGHMVQTLLGVSEEMTVNVTFRLEENNHKSALKRIEDLDAAQGAHSGRSIPDEKSHLDWDSGGPVGPISYD